ncbi:MAG TPA: acyl-CoA desaturase [Tepidisphaeraceae bacterium]|nr:acyl-CoA desaturase [Tepidisphaeraceae bacterium]
MDLLTPAQRWATREQSIDPDNRESHDAPHRPMPMAQQVTMFLSVVGPIAGLVAAIVLLWHRGPASIGWPEIVAMLGMYALAGFGVTIGYHRLLTHKSFETYRWLRLLLAICGSVAAQGQAIRWSATHRRHHQTSDHEGDPHSPHMYGDTVFALIRGIWHSHVGWLFFKDVPDSAGSVADLLIDPALVLIDKLYFFWVTLGIVVPGAVVGIWTNSWHGFISGAIWGGLVRVCLMQHVTWSINSVCHVWGRRPFRTSDHSANNWICAIFALGEGWHNNHHAFPTSARHGLHWWQFDSSWLIIRTMGAIGLVWNIRTPSMSAMELKVRSVEMQPVL